MKTVVIIIGVILLILGVGFLVTSGEPQPAANDADTAATTGAPDTTPQPAATGTPTSDSAEANANDTGIYTEYTQAVVAESAAAHIVLFFHATWCPSCRRLDADITENAAAIPADVAIYKVDFDTATALRQRYGVTVQHSVLEIGRDGAAESDITHPRTLNDLLTNLDAV